MGIEQVLIPAVVELVRALVSAIQDGDRDLAMTIARRAATEQAFDNLQRAKAARAARLAAK